MDEKTIIGILESYEIANTGKNQDGDDWTLYRYKIDGKTYSGFIDGKEYLKKTVKVIYTEKENPKNENFPYKNVKSIELSEMKVPVEAVEKNEPNNPQFLGMCMNQAVSLVAAKMANDPDYTVNEETYKRLVRQFHKWNTELKGEL